MNAKNYMVLIIPSKSQNEAFARVATAAFAAQLDPTIEELADIKTAVSEAVTNSIIHGYEDSEGEITIKCRMDEYGVEIEIRDEGKGIQDVEQARQPLYTSKPELERSGMGFTVMETFMDEVEVYSEKEKGTVILMRKKFASLAKEQGVSGNEG
ncbi:MAG: anti-sigma F factor [Clostridia bacterium]|jgi:stage II sporulation protein AB (anti-sigma F factor)|nr:anti-sigma F factor [Clostridiales bacterium]